MLKTDGGGEPQTKERSKSVASAPEFPKNTKFVPNLRTTGQTSKLNFKIILKQQIISRTLGDKIEKNVVESVCSVDFRGF